MLTGVSNLLTGSDVPNSLELANPLQLNLPNGSKLFIQHPKPLLQLGKGALMVVCFLGAEPFDVVFECHMRITPYGDPLAILRSQPITFEGLKIAPYPIEPNLYPVEIPGYLGLPEMKIVEVCEHVTLPAEVEVSDHVTVPEEVEEFDWEPEI